MNGRPVKHPASIPAILFIAFCTAFLLLTMDLNGCTVPDLFVSACSPFRVPIARLAAAQAAIANK